jgi:DNA-binding transcriptional MerR regulator
MGYRIAEAARIVGVPATTLRYYEDIGLVDPPARAANGYRTYTDRDLDRLRFVAGATGVGIPLSDLADLVRAYDVEDCSTVAHRVVEAVAHRLARTQTRIGELVALAAQLQTVASRLADAPSAVACGADCPCLATDRKPPASGGDAPDLPDGSDAQDAPDLPGRSHPRTLVPLTRAPRTPAGGPAIACSLDAAAVPDRVSDWQTLVSRAVRREPVPGGTALTFPASPGLAADVAHLAAAEQACCPFFVFDLRITTGELRLEVRAPDGAGDVVAAMFGAT